MHVRPCRTPVLAVLGLASALLVPAGRGARAQDVPYPHGDAWTPLDCGRCHTSEGWTPTRSPLEFDHGKETGFALTASHARAVCRSCHIGMRFDEPKLSAGVCTTCHVDVHQGALGGDCRACHQPTAFSDVPALRIHARTSFPLTGTHLQISCESCHADDTGGAYSPLDPECVACHRQDYESASLDHVELGFSTRCSDCHNTIAFAGVAFDHVQVSGGFRLLGVHARIPCASCHVVPGLDPLFPGARDDDCYGCHRDDYTSEHGGSGFPTTCLTCHDVESWGGASFTDHDAQFFPIYSGAHAGRWDSCETCHATPGDFSSFTCFACHEHSESAMVDRHREVGGFVYDSRACLSCHPRGRAED